MQFILNKSLSITDQIDAVEVKQNKKKNSVKKILLGLCAEIN